MSDLELRTEAVHIWGISATQLVDDAISRTELLGQELQIYRGRDSVDHYVAAGLADAAEALGYLRRARAAIGPIVDARLAEERER